MGKREQTAVINRGKFNRTGGTAVGLFRKQRAGATGNQGPAFPLYHIITTQAGTLAASADAVADFSGVLRRISAGFASFRSHMLVFSRFFSHIRPWIEGPAAGVLPHPLPLRLYSVVYPLYIYIYSASARLRSFLLYVLVINSIVSGVPRALARVSCEVLARVSPGAQQIIPICQGHIPIYRAFGGLILVFSVGEIGI